LGIKYNPSTGIYGMDFYVQVSRPGQRVKSRRIRQSRVGLSHRMTTDDTIDWFKQKYDGIVV
jgi:large subunit ribosomal protein L11e